MKKLVALTLALMLALCACVANAEETTDDRKEIVMGALSLALVNLLGSRVGFGVEINPFTAMAVGFLDLPGAALVVALRLLL